MAAAAAEATEKVFVALPADSKAGQSTLSWALSHFGGGGGGTTIVITHVHVPSQMIPVMGSRFHASKVRPDQVALFRWVEREKVNKMLNDYVHQCSKMKVKCEKLIFEKDVVTGLVDLIALRGVTKLVILAAADRQYTRKMDRPKSKTAIEIMQRADPSCKIWFVCKGQLICTRDKKVAPASPLVTNVDHPTLQPSPHHEEECVQEEGDFVLELGLYAEIEEARMAAESLMGRALNESCRRQKADEELVSALQKAEEYKELYLEESRKREELEAALASANREIARLREAARQSTDPQDRTTARVELQEEEEMAETETSSVVLPMNTEVGIGLGTAGQAIELQEEDDKEEYVQVKLGRDNGARELQSAAFSPSSVIQSPYDDEDCALSYFLCPILQEVMRDPHVAADGFTYEAGAIRGWLEAGREVSPVTGQPLAHREVTPNLALRGVIQDCMIKRRRQHLF